MGAAMNNLYSSFFAVLQILLLGVLIFPSSLAGQENRPNIILIMADDLGYECLSCDGSQTYQTPNLDTLALSGMRFEQCYAQPLCTPSRVQIMTGRYNFRNYKMFGFFDIEEVTFANLLKKAGYATCIAGKWQLSNGLEGPHLAGFDDYCLWQIYRKIAGEMVVGSRYADPTIYVNGKLMPNTEGKYGPDIFCDFILDFIEQKKSEPFLIYYPMVLTHDPFSPPPDHPDWAIDKFASDTVYFKSMVSYMDKIVGRIIKKLNDLRLRERTLILFTGDNGTHSKIRSKINDQWMWGGKSRMTVAGTHVPLIANWKGRIPPAQIADDLVDFSDFLPTLIEAAGTAIPDDLVIDGKSFYTRLTGAEKGQREWVYSYYWGRGRDPFKKRESVQTREWKLYDNGSFYNFIEDPLEKYPIAEDQLNDEQRKINKELKEVLENIKK